MVSEIQLRMMTCSCSLILLIVALIVIAMNSPLESGQIRTFLFNQAGLVRHSENGKGPNQFSYIRTLKCSFQVEVATIWTAVKVLIAI